MKKEKGAFLYKFLKPIVGMIFIFYYRPKFIGKENIPKTGSIIIAGNHKHTYDQFLAMLSTKRILHYMAKKEYYDAKESLFGEPTILGNKISRWLVKNAGCIPVDRSIKDEEASKSAIETLNKGLALGLFPEGTRNKTNELLLPFKFGAVSLAKKTSSLIVPFAITGEYNRKAKNLTIRIGIPIDVSDLTLEEANEKLYKEVERLIKIK